MAENSKIEWTDRKVIASNGYMLIRVGKKHHLADCRGYAYEHRLVAEKKIGRRLERDEIVHHINGNTQDNRPENIDVCRSIADHRERHRNPKSNRRKLSDENTLEVCACGCGGMFPKFDNDHRPRKYLSGHNPRDTSKRDAVIAMAKDRGTVHAELISPILGSKGAAKVMLFKLFKAGLLTRKARGIYGPAH